MPVYEYQCQACAHEFEREQRITDKPVKKCPKCGALKAKRLISRTSFVLKGSGWYSDLYGSAKPAKSESGEAGEAAKPSEAAGADAKAKDAPAAPADGGASASPGKGKAKGGKSKKKPAAA